MSNDTKRKIFSRVKFGATATVWLSAFVTGVCITAQAADRVGHLIGNVIGKEIDLVQGQIPMDKVAMAWAAIIALYCLGTEALKIIRSKTLEGSDIGEGKIKEADTLKMKKVLFCTLGVALYGLLVTTFGSDVNVWWLLATFFINGGAYILGCRTTQSIETLSMSKEEFDSDGDGLDEDDDRNKDGVLDYKDIIIAFQEKGKTIPEEDAKEIAKSLFGPTGQIVFSPKKEEDNGRTE